MQGLKYLDIKAKKDALYTPKITKQEGRIFINCPVCGVNVPFVKPKVATCRSCKVHISYPLESAAEF